MRNIVGGVFLMLDGVMQGPGGPTEDITGAFDVLNRKRPLSLRMVKRLHDGLKIPYESLLTGVS